VLNSRFSGAAEDNRCGVWAKEESLKEVKEMGAGLLEYREKEKSSGGGR